LSPAEALLSELLSGAAQAALRLDQTAGERLAPLEGRSLCIHCTNPPQRVTLRVSGGQLDVLPGSENPTDATVKGNFSDLVTLLRGSTPTHKVNVTGDPTVLRDFARCFEGFEPALPGAVNGLLAPLKDLALRQPGAGEHPATALAEQARGFLEVGLGTLRNAFEAGLAPGPATAAPTPESPADALRDQLARLDAGISALDRRIDVLESQRRRRTQDERGKKAP
jgi:ubiquinone biosynthesis protein UbiJ